MIYVECSWRNEPDKFFPRVQYNEISLKVIFFVKRSIHENWIGDWILFQDVPMESLRTQDYEFVYERGLLDFFVRAIHALNQMMTGGQKYKL